MIKRKDQKTESELLSSTKKHWLCSQNSPVNHYRMSPRSFYWDTERRIKVLRYCIWGSTQSTYNKYTDGVGLRKYTPKNTPSQIFIHRLVPFLEQARKQMAHVGEDIESPMLYDSIIIIFYSAAISINLVSFLKPMSFHTHFFIPLFTHILHVCPPTRLMPRSSLVCELKPSTFVDYDRIDLQTKHIYKIYCKLIRRSNNFMELGSYIG